VGTIWAVLICISVVGFVVGKANEGVQRRRRRDELVQLQLRNGRASAKPAEAPPPSGGTLIGSHAPDARATCWLHPERPASAALVFRRGSDYYTKSACAPCAETLQGLK